MNFYNREDDQKINESFWEDVKYGLSKLGRYKVGGKFTGRSKTDQKAASNIANILNKQTNILLKKVSDEVERVAPEFPNDKNKINFLRGIILYGQFYDSLVEASQKPTNDPGYMDASVVNEIIEDLREIVKKHLDVDLKAVYSVMESRSITSNELGALDMELLNEEEEILKKLAALKDKAMDKLFGKKMGTPKAGTGQYAKFQKTSGQQNISSERIKTLQSNKLPIVLSLLGGALGTLSWILQTEWFKTLVSETIKSPDTFRVDKVNDLVSKNVIVDPNGWTYTIQNNGFMSETGKSLNFNQPIQNLKDAFSWYGDGNTEKGIESMSDFLSPEGRNPSVENIMGQLNDPSNKTVGDVFNKLEKTWGNGFLMNQNGGIKSTIINKIVIQLKKVVVKGAVSSVVTSTGSKLIGLSPILGALGISLIAAGATVKLMREKGQRQSRAKTLNDLLQSLEFVTNSGTKSETKPLDNDGDGNEGTNDGINGGTNPGANSGSEANSGSGKDGGGTKNIYALMVLNLGHLRSLLISFDGVKMQENFRLLRYDELIQEKQLGIQPRKVLINKNETHLLQAFEKISKSVRNIKDENFKGIGITPKFISDILEEKLTEEGKKQIKNLYNDVFEFLEGKYSKTLPDMDILYKESIQVISKQTKRVIVAEKIARFYKRSKQFDGQGFYSSLGEFGEDLKNFNSTLKKIIDLQKQS